MRHSSGAPWRRLGAAALLLAMAIPSLSAVHAANPRAGTMLNLWNDKQTWATYFNTEGQASLKALGVGFKSVPYPDTTTYQAAVRTAGRTSKAPDLYTWWSGYQMKDTVDAGLATDVSALWNQNKSAYSPGLRAQFTFGGKTYGLPLYLSYWEVIYNKHIFAKYHLAPPTTWAQFQAINKTLRSHGVTPLAATITGRWPAFIYFEEMLVRSNPQAYLNLMAGKIKYTDPAVVNAMNIWSAMIKEGDFTDPGATSFGTSGNNDVLSYFTKGKVGMIEIGSWYEPTITATGFKPGVDYGAFIMPNMNPKAGKNVIFETSPLVVSAHGPHQAQALKAATYFMSKAGQQAWINATGFIPARNDVKASNSLDQQMSATVNTGYNLIPRYWEATPFDIVNVAVDQFAKFMLHPGDPMPILSTIQSQADRSWASQH
ncbi:MAG TPA: extracellular solute-binding protein [Chloroflexota bacterium]|nr:extracellular solute-binding protein [Chloroflexota bacterium]